MTDNDATDERPTLFPEPLGSLWYLVRVNPKDRGIPDPITQEPIFEALHDLEFCIGDDQVRLLSKVVDNLMSLQDGHLTDDQQRLMAEATIDQVLRHPDTPYGLGLRPKHKSVRRYGDMTVIYRQRVYTRDKDGVLTRLPGSHGFWPARDQWRVNNYRTRLWARRNGLLP
jgi:hypothetical protein